MTLRARLLLSLGALLAVALVVTGGLVVGLTRQSLVQQLDEDLRTASPADRSLGNGGGPGPDEPTGRRFALLVYSLDGEELRTIPSGLAHDPDPLPLLPADGVSVLQLGQIIERPSVDGAVSYRLLAFRGRVEGPRILNVIGILGAPMTGVDQSVAVVVRSVPRMVHKR